jgi:uncharacterized protein (DUF433 family)
MANPRGNPCVLQFMSARIINRGRGPEIEGTRITVYTIMDFEPYNCTAQQIADELQVVSVEQVQAALDYIASHRKEVDAEYAKIMERIKRGNPPWVEELLAKSETELSKRIRALRAPIAEGSAENPSD